MSQNATPPMRRKHLLDPDNLRPQAPQSMSMSQVQKWVLSVLAMTTVGLLSAGMVVAAVFLDESRPGAQVGLDVIAGFVGVLGVAAAFLIHGKRPLTPWLLAGLLPAAIGLYVIL